MTTQQDADTNIQLMSTCDTNNLTRQLLLKRPTGNVIGVDSLSVRKALTDVPAEK